MKALATWRAHPNRAAFAVLFAAIVIPYWRLALLQDVVITDDMFISDIANGEFPARVEMGRLLRQGQWGMWSEQLFGGYELAFHDPFTLFFFVCFPPIFAVNYCHLAILLWAAFGTFHYVRALHRPWTAAVLAGALFAYSGYMTCQLKHIGVVATVSWIPWCLLALQELLRANSPESRLRASAWMALAYGGQVLAGFPQTAYLCALGYGVYAGSVMFERYRHRVITRMDASTTALHGVASMGLAVGVGAATLLPIWALSKYADRQAEASWEFATYYNYQARSLLGLLYPYANGDISNNTYRLPGIAWEDYIYVGALCLFLAAFAFYRLMKKGSTAPDDEPGRDLRALAWMGLFSMIVGMGALTPLYRVLFLWLPGMSTFRTPQRFFCVTTFALVVLGAHGWELIAEKLRAFPRGPALAAALSVLVALDPLALNFSQNGFANAETWLRAPDSVAIVAQHPHAIILSPGSKAMHTRAFRASPGWQSEAPYRALRAFLQPDINLHWNVAALGGYAGIAPDWSSWLGRPGGTLDLIWKTALLGQSPLLSIPVKISAINGVDFVMLADDIPALTSLSQSHVVSGPVHIYALDSVPDVYLADHASPAPEGNAHALQAQMLPDFVVGHSVQVHATAAAMTREAERYSTGDAPDAVSAVRWLARTPSEQRLRVTSRGQWLVNVGTYTPDWRATIDGRDAAVYRANVRQRAMFVPPGTHDVVFSYRPQFTTYGRWLTALSLVIVAAVLARSRARQHVVRPLATASDGAAHP